MDLVYCLAIFAFGAALLGLRSGSRRPLERNTIGASPHLRSFILSGILVATGLGAGKAFAENADATELPAICTDRPAKSNATCTVEAGHLQYEADLVNYTRLHVDGVRTETWLATNPTVKFGLTDSLDVELNVAPWAVVRTRDDHSGATAILRGPGDVFTRVKWKLYGDDQVTAALLPYIKAPTARHGIGNGAVESGLLVPIGYAWTDKITLTTVPEVDSLKDADGVGHHFNTAQLVNIGYALPNNVSVYGELWGNWNVDPTRTVRQFSADIAVAWGVTKFLQVDAGVNVGLNSNTPRAQVYVGVAQKF